MVDHWFLTEILISIKLPTTKLPKFSDKLLDFHDSFDSLIMKNTSFREILRLNHLIIIYLSGSASKIISSISVSNNNFNLAWELICEPYANNNLLVHSQFKAIFNIPKINKEN